MTSSFVLFAASDLPKPQGLAALDWVIIIIYASATIGLGWYYSRRQRSRQEYFVGSGSMNPMLIGVSLFATLLSTISYLSIPGEALGKGPVVMTGMLALPVVYFIVGHVLLPVYMRQRVTSAYELLEAKLGSGIRILGASMFIVLRLAWMSLLIYLAAKAMTTMMDLEERHIPVIVLVTGTVAVVYTSLGGLRAVVITDALQTMLLFGGALLVLVTITVHFGGFGWFPTTWQANWDKQPVFDWNPKTRITMVGIVFSTLTWQICTAGGDQVSVQRFMATGDARAARRALVTQLAVQVTVAIALYLVGFALLGYFQAHRELLPDGFDLKNDADFIFPHYIAYRLPVGVSGLVVAAMFAAAMSSIDSGVNSITAVVSSDFLERMGLQPESEKGQVRVAQILALTIGGLVVIGSSSIGQIPGNITAVTAKTTNLLVTPIFALFFFALFVPFARPLGVAIGAVAGIATASLIAFSGSLVTVLATQYDVDPQWFGVELIPSVDPDTGQEKLMAEDPVSFQWIGPVALVVNLAIGSIASLIFRRR